MQRETLFSCAEVELEFAQKNKDPTETIRCIVTLFQKKNRGESLSRNKPKLANMTLVIVPLAQLSVSPLFSLT